MNTITFTLKLRLACYVAKACVNYQSIRIAIAKATLGKVWEIDKDNDVTVTISERELVIAFQQLTVLAEGLAATRNNTLEDLMTPLLAGREQLALDITALKESNQTAGDDMEYQGWLDMKELHTALNNN